MKKLTILLLAALPMLVFSCKKDGGPVSVQTGDYSDVTVVSARLHGKLSSKDVPSDAVYGILISKKGGVGPDNADRILAAGCDSDGSFSVDTVGLSPSEPYFYRAFLEVAGRIKTGRERSFRTGELSDGRVVDLGLSVLWASCNVGATLPQEIGKYYAWGELTVKDYYSRTNYKWAGADKYGSGSGPKLPALEAEDDIARQQPGGDLRIPTEDELKELMDDATHVWTTYRGQAGRVVMSRSSDASIFLPAGGYKEGTELKKSGELGEYWSSTPWDSFYAGIFEFLVPPGDKWLQKVAIMDRHLGLTIRAVKDKP